MTSRFDIYHRHCVQLMQTMDRISANGLPLDSTRVQSFTKELDDKFAERFATLQTIAPDELKGLHPENGYKHPPKDTTGLVQRVFAIPPTKLSKLEKSVINDDFLLPDKVNVQRWCKVEPFLPTSPTQITALIKHFGAKPGTNRKTKRETTDAETLRKLIKTGEKSRDPKLQTLAQILKLSKECRQLSKVSGTYARGWRPGSDGRIHSTPGLWGAMHRISWRDPNIAATIADKQEDYVAKGFRKCVRVPPGRILVECDWRGIEAVLVGYFAGDNDFMRLGRLGVHDYFCYHLLAFRRKIPQSAIPSLALSDGELKAALKVIKREFPADRDDAKHIVHGINYGETPFLISALYEIERSEAIALHKLFFDVFPKVKAWQERTLAEADAKHKLRNVWGAEMDFWEVKRWNSRKARGEGGWELGSEAKSALAFRPRDTAAGMLKEVLLSEPIQNLINQGFTIATAHDAILNDVPEPRLMEVAGIVKREMERKWKELDDLTVEVECKVGTSWSDEMEVLCVPQEQ